MNTKAVGNRIQIAREKDYMIQKKLSKVGGCTLHDIGTIGRGTSNVDPDYWALTEKRPHNTGSDFPEKERRFTDVSANSFLEEYDIRSCCACNYAADCADASIRYIYRLI